MPGVVRMGDINSAGGAVIGSTAGTVFVNGQLCAVIGSLISSHEPYGPPHPPHEAATITTGNNTVIVEGQPIAIQGSNNTCGHVMTGCSGDVFA
jgi:uncharacterized Zn-binding protein involved in type VI secretion